MKTLGKYLKKHRGMVGYTQHELAMELGYGSAQFISNIERDMAMPPFKSLRKLKKLIGVDVTVVSNYFRAELEAKLKRSW